MMNTETVYGTLGGRDVRVIVVHRRTGFGFMVQALGRTDGGRHHQFFDNAEEAEAEAKRLVSNA